MSQGENMGALIAGLRDIAKWSRFGGLTPSWPDAAIVCEKAAAKLELQAGLADALERLISKYRGCARAHGNSDEVVESSMEFARTALNEARRQAS